jgi:hypothetical protein
MTRTTDTDDLRGGKASVDAWIAFRVSLVAASASEVTPAERIRRIRDNMANDESERAGGGGGRKRAVLLSRTFPKRPKAVEVFERRSQK